jgi:hypothetical protein
MVQKIKHPKHEISIALVGKYAGLKECYKSLAEALVHGGIDHETKVNITWIESEDVERQGTERILREADGILIPGGFGTRGVEGKILTIKYAREREVPFLGLCLGMQCATIEFARNVAGLAGANSSEFDEQSPHPVIHLMSDQQSVSDKGGTMRLGSYLCKLGEGTLAQKMYGVNESAGTGIGTIQQCLSRATYGQGIGAERSVAGWAAGRECRLRSIPGFCATQFHPEYRSRPHHTNESRSSDRFSFKVGAGNRLSAGPRVIEQLVLDTTAENCGDHQVAGIPYVFKSSFDKANRTASSHAGARYENGLAVLKKVKEQLGLPVLTGCPYGRAGDGGGQGCRCCDSAFCVAKRICSLPRQDGKVVNVKKGNSCRRLKWPTP